MPHREAPFARSVATVNAWYSGLVGAVVLQIEAVFRDWIESSD